MILVDFDFVGGPNDGWWYRKWVSSLSIGDQIDFTLPDGSTHTYEVTSASTVCQPAEATCRYIEPKTKPWHVRLREWWAR